MIYRWRFERGFPGVAPLAERLLARTNVAVALQKLDIAGGFMSFSLPRVAHGGAFIFPFDPNAMSTYRERGFPPGDYVEAEFDSFPPSPYVAVQLDAAMRDLGGERIELNTGKPSAAPLDPNCLVPWSEYRTPGFWKELMRLSRRPKP